MSPTGSSVTPATYTFRVRILGGVYAPPDGQHISREFELTGNQTLGDLGEAIPLAFGFDDPHLWSFFLSGKPWDDATEYARSPSRTMAGRHGQPTGCASVTPRQQGVPLLFDYGDEWHFGVRLVRTGAASKPGVRYPLVVASRGQAPAQYPPVENDWDEQTEDDEEFLAQWEKAEAVDPAAGAAGSDAGAGTGRGADGGLPAPANRPPPARPGHQHDPASRGAGPPAAGR